jgi:hypothetical protein
MIMDGIEENLEEHSCQTEEISGIRSNNIFCYENKISISV